MRYLHKSLYAKGKAAVQCSFGLIAVTLVLLLSTSSFASPITIDDFSSPDPAHIYSLGVAPIDVSVQDATTGLGGERDVVVDVVGSATPLPFSAAGVIGGGVMSLSSDSGSTVITTLQYDGLDFGSDLDNAEGLGGVDLTDAAGPGDPNDSFLLTFESIDAGILADGLLDFSIEVHSAGGTAIFDGTLDETESPATYIVGFTEFTTSGSFSFADVTSIEIVFNDPVGFAPFQGVDFILSDISVAPDGGVIPEPSTYVLAMMGLLSLVGLRWRRKI